MSNEPAFPVADLNTCKWAGLTKREYFAAMALQGICASDANQETLTTDQCANYALKAADALLAELTK